MKYTILLFIATVGLLVFPAILNAQEEVKNRWNMKIGYSRIDNCQFSDGNIGDLTVECNYRISKFFETGFYTGYSLCRQKRISPDDGIFSTNANVLSYGINSYFLLSTLFLKDGSMLGIRVIAKPGGLYVYSHEDCKPHGFNFTFRTGLGIDLRILRKTGLFGEYVYGFGDGIYRDNWEKWEITDRKHIGSFRFGLHFVLSND